MQHKDRLPQSRETDETIVGDLPRKTKLSRVQKVVANTALAAVLTGVVTTHERQLDEAFGSAQGNAVAEDVIISPTVLSPEQLTPEQWQDPDAILRATIAYYGSQILKQVNHSTAETTQQYSTVHCQLATSFLLPVQRTRVVYWIQRM
jgi:hypothetical protein